MKALWNRLDALFAGRDMDTGASINTGKDMSTVAGIRTGTGSSTVTDIGILATVQICMYWY